MHKKDIHKVVSTPVGRQQSKVTFVQRNAELFADFADSPLQAGFARENTAAGEFPQTAGFLAGMPLRDQKFTPGVCDPNLAADVVFTVDGGFNLSILFMGAGICMNRYFLRIF